MFVTFFKRILIPAQSLLKDLHTGFQCKLDPQLIHQSQLHWKKDEKQCSNFEPILLDYIQLVNKVNI